MSNKVCKWFVIFTMCFSFAGAYAIENKNLNTQEQTKAHKPPILTIAAIIEVYQDKEFLGIVLIERGKAPWGKALPGGKVEYGETVENAIRREMMEEVNLELFDLQQFHVYSDL